MRSQEETTYKYRRGLNLELCTTALCFISWGNKKELAKETENNQQCPRSKREERFQRKLATMSNATATSSDAGNEDWLGNLSPRRSLVISTRAVTAGWKRKKLQQIQKRLRVPVTRNNNSRREVAKEKYSVGEVLCCYFGRWAIFQHISMQTEIILQKWETLKMWLLGWQKNGKIAEAMQCPRQEKRNKDQECK